MVSLALVVCESMAAIVTLAIFVTEDLDWLPPVILTPWRPRRPLCCAHGGRSCSDCWWGFAAAEAWSNSSSAEQAVDQEASALRSVRHARRRTSPAAAPIGGWIC